MSNVPKLRFKEFGGEWEKKDFGNIYSFLQTNSFSRALLNYESGEIKNIHYGDIHTKFKSNFYLKNEKVPYINSEVDISKIKEENYCKEKDLVIADASEDYKDIGKAIEIINLNDEKLLAGLHTYIARDEKNVMAKGFSGYLMQTQDIRLQMMKLATGISVLGISKGNLLQMKINIPSKPEQEKIASFLTSVDTKIEQLTKKEALLQEYKKSVMNKIFNQEIRFKDDDGSEFPEWEEKRLGEIGKFQTSSIDKLSKEDEKEIYLINYMDVYRHKNINNKTIKDFQVVTAKQTQIESCNLLQGDILFTPSSETPDDIGHSVVIFENLDNAVFSYHLMRFRPSIKINILYSHYFCNIPSVLNQLAKFSTGSTRFTISVKSFSLIIIKLPCIKEQTKIANFLSSIDKKIELTTKELNSTKEFKKALLQQMFV